MVRWLKAWAMQIERLGLLHELLPGAVRFALLVTPGTTSGESTIAEVELAAAAIGRQVEILSATTNLDIDAAFARLAQKRADGLLVAPQILFSTRRVQLVTLAARHALPTIHYQRAAGKCDGELAVLGQGFIGGDDEPWSPDEAARTRAVRLNSGDARAERRGHRCCAGNQGRRRRS